MPYKSKSAVKKAINNLTDKQAEVWYEIYKKHIDDKSDEKALKATWKEFKKQYKKSDNGWKKRTDEMSRLLEKYVENNEVG